MTPVSQLYKSIWNFRIMGFKTSKPKEWQNPASVWNHVLSEMLLRSRQSLRERPLAMCLPSHMFLGTFAKVRCFECRQLRQFSLSSALRSTGPSLTPAVMKRGEAPWVSRKKAGETHLVQLQYLCALQPCPCVVKLLLTSWCRNGFQKHPAPCHADSPCTCCQDRVAKPKVLQRCLN